MKNFIFVIIIFFYFSGTSQTLIFLSLKSEWEIDPLRISCKALTDSFASVPDLLKPGMTEVEFAELFGALFRKSSYGGCSKMLTFNQVFWFDNIVSGKSGVSLRISTIQLSTKALLQRIIPWRGYKLIERDERYL